MVLDVMTLEKLKKQYKDINVKFDDDFTLKRAIIYYDFVKKAYDSLTGDAIKQELSKIQGGYERVELAITTSGLLIGLCKILDRYIVPAINADLKQKGSNYGQYFGSFFQLYPKSVTDFLSDYPLSTQALAKVNASFKKNILTACKRVLNDWQYLQNMFVDQKNSFLDKLVDIRSTGSDFHKGGQQVLILTFTTKPTGAPLRIVYKPSDLEVDCLIIGNTQAVNVIRPKFQEASLMELLNNELRELRDHLDLKLYEFPTYKILPIYPGSQLQRDENGQLPIRNSYGYIQFLEYNGIINNNPSLEKKEVCERFYCLLGQLTAVACLFSLSDVHIENLIVHQYTPYLIDLENSLTRPINRVIDTEMIGDGAIDGVDKEEFIPVCNDNSKEITPQSIWHIKENRLWEAPHALITTANYCQPMLYGFAKTMQLIQQGHANSRYPFAAWFRRLETGAIVRIVPLGTGDFQMTITFVFSPRNKKDIPTAAAEDMKWKLSQAYDDWAKDPTKIPRFLCLQRDYIIDDIVNVDVPVFYHRLNTTDVMDSWGTTITIPDTIDIGDKRKPVKANLQRDTFFPKQPLVYVETVQLEDLQSGNTSDTKSDELLKQLKSVMQSMRDADDYKQIYSS